VKLYGHDVGDENEEKEEEEEDERRNVPSRK
jgi:hypothetical protein